MLNSSYYQLGRDFICVPDHNKTFTYHGLKHTFRNIELGLRGDFQLQNAALALSAAEILMEKNYPIEEKALFAGLRTVSWPGRLEPVNTNPLVILDGAHNPAAMKNLKTALFNTFDFSKLLLVLGMMEDKEIENMVRVLVPSADQVILCKPRMDRAATTQALASTIKDFHVTYHQIDDVTHATRYALTLAQSDDLICVTGSLFTVGEARKLFM